MSKIKKLEGQELISKLKELKNLGEEEKAKACGYYSRNKEGKESVHLKPFLSAVLAANGLSDSSAKETRSRGRQPNTELKINPSRQLVIGGAHLSQLGLDAGDMMSIAVGRNKIVLSPVKGGKAGEEDGEAEEQNLEAEIKELSVQQSAKKSEQNGAVKKLAYA